MKPCTDPHIHTKAMISYMRACMASSLCYGCKDQCMVSYMPACFLTYSICCCDPSRPRAIAFMYPTYNKARLAPRSQELSVSPSVELCMQVRPHTAHAGPAAGSRILAAVRAVRLSCEDIGPGHLLHARAAPGLCDCSSRSVSLYSVVL